MKPVNTAGHVSRNTAGSAGRDTLSATEACFPLVAQLSSDYYWEQDDQHRFTVFRRADQIGADGDLTHYIGRTCREIGIVPVVAADDGLWGEHGAPRDSPLPFRDLIVRHVDSQGRLQILRISGVPAYDDGDAFLGYRGLATDVTQQVRYEQLLDLGLKVSRSLSDGGRSIDAVRRAIQLICESEEWQAGQYWCLDPQNDVMRLHVGWHVPDSRIGRVAERARDLAIGRGIGLVGAVWQSGEPLWIPDITGDQRVLRKDIAEQTGWKSAILVPVTSQGHTIGVLDFNSPFIPEPGDYLLHVIAELGRQIGQFHERAATVQRLTESEERYSSTVELAAIGISHVATDGRFMHVNRQLCEMLGYTREELLTRTVQDVSHPDDANLTDDLGSKLRSGEINSFKAEKRYVRRDGTMIWVRITVAEKRNDEGDPLYDISIVEDISERKLAETRVEYLATHDEMTGLPNRSMFAQLLGRAIEASTRYERHFAVLFIDLDRFKAINDSLGHEAGDVLLKEMASRFKRCVRASDVVARLGGDEFVVLVDELAKPEQAALVARNLISAALEPVLINGQECRVTASIGIAAYPADGGDAESLMKNADAAMYLAKEEGKNNFQLYSKDIRALSVERLALESQLAHALERNEFRLQYQAKVSIRTGEISGVEALLRWWNPDLGAVSPVQFIPVAEDTGLIVPIGKWVLLTACQQSMAWQREGLAPVCVAVNVSARQFKDPRLLDDIAEVIETTGIDPGLLELEITESMVMHNLDSALQKLRAIKKMGVRLAIDDFGTGYSSLAQLKRFPIDTLKVDRSFIREIQSNAQDQAITEAIIAMGRNLGVTVVAEGVETAEQQAFLSSRACDEMQGYYFSKPSHPDGFAKLLRKQVA